MKDFYSIRINFRGGVVSPGELSEILLVAKEVNIHEVRLSLRQQLILHLPHAHSKKFEKAMNKLNIAYQIDENHLPNMVSSYVAEDVFQKGNWITEGIYKDVFNSFDYEPRLKINVSDNAQSFSPFFSGHLNFVASNIPNFWYLFVRLPKTNEVLPYQKLIFTNEIAQVCKTLENAVDENKSSDAKEILNQIPKIIALDKEEELKLPKFTLPYYEGFNRYGNKTWLGIYRRNERFSVNFLLELCELCHLTKIGEFCITPWKSIIIKGIKESDRNHWSAILAKFSINVRHAANELNWQVEDDSEVALDLKNKMVEAFNKLDIRTFGVCFGIKTVPKTEVFASIMIQKRRFKILNFIPSFFVYDISYTLDFDPNGRTKKYFSTGIIRPNLAEQLRRSVVFYNHQLADDSIQKLTNQLSNTELPIIKTKRVFQCSTCFSVYDNTYGDTLANIPAGITFENLPENYCCGVCDEPKKNFSVLEMEEKV